MTVKFYYNIYKYIVILALVITPNFSYAENLRSQILEAAEKEDLYQIRQLIRKGANPNTMRRDGVPLIHIAIVLGSEKTVWQLVRNGADLEIKSPLGELPLHIAARYNKDIIIRMLIEKGAKIESKDAQANTPLHIATFYGNLESAALLMEMGASSNKVNIDRLSAVHIAAIEGEIEMIEFLAKQGANLDKKNADGKTALHMVLSEDMFLPSYKKKTATVKALIAAGAKHNLRDNNGKIPIDYVPLYQYEIIEILTYDVVDFNKK